MLLFSGVVICIAQYNISPLQHEIGLILYAALSDIHITTIVLKIIFS